MQLSANGRRLIQRFEGLSLTAYPDAAGYSIGYGHYGAQPGQTITREEAEKLFDQDVARFELAVSLATPTATQDQFDAMTSLAYNVGTKAFSESTLVRKHNMGDVAGAADEFLRWNKSQGKVLPALAQRRELERSVYLHGHGSYYPTPAQTPVESEPGQVAAVAGGDGAALIAGVGLVFFCPGCFGRFRSVGVAREVGV